MAVVNLCMCVKSVCGWASNGTSGRKASACVAVGMLSSLGHPMWIWKSIWWVCVPSHAPCLVSRSLPKSCFEVSRPFVDVPNPPSICACLIGFSRLNVHATDCSLLVVPVDAHALVDGAVQFSHRILQACCWARRISNIRSF